MRKAPRVSEAEWQVMKVILKDSPITAEQIAEDLHPTTAWKLGTVKTLLNRLQRKRALKFEKIGKAYRYSPAFREDEFRAAEADSFLHRMFDGQLSPLLAHFVRSRRLNPKEVAELEQILRNERPAR